jgi:putative endonuclease
VILKRLVRLTGQSLTQKQGAAAEELALAHLQRVGLALVCRNYRAAGGSSGKQLGEIDLIMRTRDGALVFVEVRERGSAQFGGAAESVTRGKQARLIKAAQHYLQTLPKLPACRFDVVAVTRNARGEAALDWIENAFDAI